MRYPFLIPLTRWVRRLVGNAAYFPSEAFGEITTPGACAEDKVAACAAGAAEVAEVASEATALGSADPGCAAFAGATDTVAGASDASPEGATCAFDAGAVDLVALDAGRCAEAMPAATINRMISKFFIVMIMAVPVSSLLR